MKTGKRISAIVLSFIIAAGASFAVYSEPKSALDSVKSAVEGIISYKSSTYDAESTEELLNNLSLKAGEFSSDWYYIALSLYGVDCANSKSIAALKSAASSFYSEDLSKVKVTDMQRVAFALLACKQSITNVNGHNLLADCTFNRAKYRPLDAQGVNSVAYALLLLDSIDYKIPDNAETSRRDMIDLILDKELENGGFALFGASADIDITTIAVQALAPYTERSDVKKSVDRSIEILSSRQTASGAYKSFADKACAESTAQVMLALVASKLDPINDSRFIKDGNSLLDGLLSFRKENGAFSHFADGSEDNMATYQSLCALVACYRYLNGQKSFYDFKSAVEETTEKTDELISKTHKQQDQKTKDNNSKNKSASKKKKNNSKSEKNTEPTASVKHIKLKTYRAEKISKKKTKSKTKSNKNQKPAESQAATASQTTAATSKKQSKPIKNDAQAEQPLFVSAGMLTLLYVLLFASKVRRK